MRVLILSGNTGEGHNSCAKAIKEVFDSNGVYCVAEDGFRFISDKASQILSKGHSFIYRHIPSLFDKGYHLVEELPESFSEDSMLYSFFARGCDKLYEFISADSFDTVICTHPFNALMLTEVKKKYNVPLKKTAFVATDHTCSPSVKDSDLDVYFIPSESLKEDFECTNITKDKIYASGIPVRQMFYNNQAKDIAKKELGLSESSKHIVIACGSMGCGPLKELIEHFSEKRPEDTEVTVICGRNQKLFEQLSAKYNDFPQIHICDYVKEMALMLDSADLYITKAGGISTAEAITKKLPMVLIDAVGGCEDYNKEFLVKAGIATEGKTVTEILEACEELLSDTDKYTKMTEAFNSLEVINSAKFIYDLLSR